MEKADSGKDGLKKPKRHCLPYYMTHGIVVMWDIVKLYFYLAPKVDGPARFSISNMSFSQSSSVSSPFASYMTCP